MGPSGLVYSFAVVKRNNLIEQHKQTNEREQSKELIMAKGAVFAADGGSQRVM